MAIPLKLLLIKPGDCLGNGLAAIRERESEFIDISGYEIAMSDATATTNPGYIIKDNSVYRIIKTYFDLDKSVRIALAKQDNDVYDVWPLPSNENESN